MRYLTIDQIRRATGGTLLRGSSRARAENISTDSRAIKPVELFVALRGPNFDGHDYVPDVLARGAAGAVVDREYQGLVQAPHRHRQGALIAVDDTLRALGDIACHYRSTLPTKIIAVTGSNGKTTTKAMIHHIVQGEMPCVASPASFNNAVGVPATLFLIDPQHRAAVVEMGTNHPGEIRYLAEMARPHVAVITNVSATHLEGLSTPRGVAEEKAAILAGLVKDGMAVFNRDDFWCRDIEKRYSGPRMGFGVDSDAEVRARDVQQDERGLSFTCAGLKFRLPVLGEFNVGNALAAAAAARAIGVSWETIRDRLEIFHLPRMRMQIDRIGGAVVINDAYNANPASMLAALRTLAAMPGAGRRIFVMGDMKELGERTAECHRDLGRKVAASGIDVLWATGPEAARAADTALHQPDPGGSGQPAPRMLPEQVYHSPDTRDAAKKLPGFIQAGDVVLVKGSRALEMEQVVEAIKENLRRRPPLPMPGRAARLTPPPYALPDAVPVQERARRSL